MSKKEEIQNRIFEFVVKANKKIKREDINEDTPLLEKRIINSLHVMELLLLVEEITGKGIDVKSIKPGVFSSVKTIMDGFFKSIEG